MQGIDVNCGRKDGRSDGRAENRTPISHLAQAGATKSSKLHPDETVLLPPSVNNLFIYFYLLMKMPSSLIPTLVASF